MDHMPIRSPDVCSKAVRSTANVGIAELGLAAAALLPGIFVGIILYLQRLPYPYLDDYNAVLNFSCLFKNAHGFTAKAMQVAVFQHNSYRLILEHGFICADIALAHHLNFGFLTAVGDLFLFGIFALLWRSFEEMPFKKKLLFFLPVSFTFFSLCYWETLNWVEASLQNVPSPFFALASLYLLDKTKNSYRPKGRFLLACVAALLGCCSSVNGFLLAPVGALMLASQRRSRHAFFWLLSFILPLMAYMDHPILQPVQHGFFLTKLYYFVAFFGSALLWSTPAFLAGLALLGLLIWAARSHFAHKNPVLFFFALWIVLTGALVESVRMSIASRYSIYSILLVVSCYTFVLRALNAEDLQPSVHRPWLLVPLQRRRFLQVALALSICFYLINAAWAYRRLAVRRQTVSRGLRFYNANPITNSPQANPVIDSLYPDERRLELGFLNEAVHEGLYIAPSGTSLGK
jgi:hypothetical protein